MNTTFLFLIFITFFILSNCNFQSPFDTSTVERKRLQKPQIIRDIIYCQSCVQIVVGALKALHGSHKEMDIEYALIELMDNKNRLSKVE